VHISGLRFVVGGFSDTRDFIVSRVRRGEPGVYLPCSLYDIALIYKDIKYSREYKTIDYCTTDGMPLVWLARILGYQPVDRVYGPDLTISLLSGLPATSNHVFFVPSETTKIKLNKALRDRLSVFKETNVCVVPKNHTSFNITRVLSFVMKNDTRVIFWIGIGSPNQVFLANKLRAAFPKATIFCVGAALDLFTGVKPMAPVLLQCLGFEWLFRLIVEPRRLWRRYLIDIPRFLFQAGFLSLRRWFWSWRRIHW